METVGVSELLLGEAGQAAERANCCASGEGGKHGVCFRLTSDLYLRRGKTMALSLDGITILDLTRLLQGPFCTLILADLGADVVRVEEPQPPASRVPAIWQVPRDELERKRKYESLFRNKRSIALNLKTSQGREIFYELARQADVIVEEFRAGVSKRLGVDYETIRRIKPDIIYGAISGYGQYGPYKDLPGYDPNFESVGGLLGLTGCPDGKHVIPGVPVADLATGIMGAVGILAALHWREKTGKGQFMDLCAVDTVAYLIGVFTGVPYFSKGLKPRRGSRLSHVYETQDGKYLSFAFGFPVFWERLCHTLGLDKFISYWKEIQALGFEDSMPASVRERQQEAVTAVAEVLRTKSREEWFRILSEADISVSPVYELDEVFSDPHILARQMVLKLEDPALGKIEQVGIPIKLSETPGMVRKLPPMRGQHTRELLKQLGHSDVDIELLQKQGVIG